MQKACLVLAFTALLGGVARPAAPAEIDRWDATLVTGVLFGLGVHDIKSASVGGQPGLLAQTSDGLSMGVYAKACAAPADPAAAAPVCRAIEGVIGYDPGAAADRSLLADKLNHDFAAGKFMVERDGSVRLTRYLNLDGGVSQANLRAELADFLAVASAAKQTLWAPPAP